MSTLKRKKPKSSEYLRPYEEMVERIGPRFEALLWNSPETQLARFEAIAEMINLAGRVVVDAGCGRGDLVAFLSQRGIVYGRYIGVDAVPALLDVGRELNLPEAEFIEADFAAETGVFGKIRPSPEIIIFSGSLNTFEPRLVHRTLHRAWVVASEALVFNFLSDRNGRDASDETGPARRFDTIGMLDWAFSRTPLVSFRQDYLGGNDATIVMRKGN